MTVARTEGSTRGTTLSPAWPDVNGGYNAQRPRGLAGRAGQRGQRPQHRTREREGRPDHRSATGNGTEAIAAAG